LNTTIGENLGQALINLRKDEEDLRLSADAICITQQDNVEKSWQVELMGDVFNTALLTYVWLRPTPGDHDESSAQALDMILEIGKSCKDTKSWATYGQTMGYSLLARLFWGNKEDLS
jgi:hypothetical protein